MIEGMHMIKSRTIEPILPSKAISEQQIHLAVYQVHHWICRPVRSNRIPCYWKVGTESANGKLQPQVRSVRRVQKPKAKCVKQSELNALGKSIKPGRNGN